MHFKYFFRFFLPLLFASVILSTSEFSSVPHENDIDWEAWDEAEFQESRSAYTN